MTLLQSVQRLSVFDSLHNRDFRWFWLARLAHSASMEMGNVAQGWLVYQLAGSALALGWVSSARSIARLLLSFYGGALADRLQRRQVLIWARAAMLANVLAVAILILLDPLSTLPAGAIADAWGVPVALTLQGGLMAAIFGVLWLSRSRVRYLD